MGVHCYLIQVPEPELMHLNEADVPGTFDRARADRVASVDLLRAYELADWSDQPVPALYLEKSWWMLHLFLTGKDAAAPEEGDPSSPPSRAILGGRPIGAELHQGPARYLWAAEVREIAEALSSQALGVLVRSYSEPSGPMRTAFAAAMESGGHDIVLDGETFDWLVGLIDLLATYYRIAAARGNAILLGLT